MRLYASAAANSGMTIDGAGVGTSVTGEVRVVQNGGVIATGTINASAGGGDAVAAIFLNNDPDHSGADRSDEPLAPMAKHDLRQEHRRPWRVDRLLRRMDQERLSQAFHPPPKESPEP